MIKYVTIADLISMLNIGFGFLAIFILSSDLFFSGFLRIHVAFSLILLALLADGLDGIIARRTNPGSLGEYIESMADMTSMGIAPIIFIYTQYQKIIHIDTVYQILFLAGFFLYLFLCVIRLACFHQMKNDEYFIGLPASAATIMLLILASFSIQPIVMIASLVLISLLLISSFPFPKTDRRINAIASILILLAIIFGAWYQVIFLSLLFSCVLFYAIGGSLFIIHRKKTIKKG